jgi:integrase
MNAKRSVLRLVRPNDSSLVAPDPVATYLDRTMPSSQPTLRLTIAKAARLLDIPSTPTAWAALRYVDTLRLRSLCEARRADGSMALATANHLLSAVRCVLKECWRLGLIPADDYHRAIDIPPLRGSTLPAGRALSEPELGAILAVCRDDPTPSGIRDLCLLALLITTGMRRNELVRVELADLTETRIIIRFGKGGKERVAHVTPELQVIITEWLAVRGDWPGPLLCGVHRTAAIQRRGLSAASVYDILGRRAAEAGIAHCSPHDCRRTTASRLYAAGADIYAISRLLGHAKVTTTQRYVRVGDEADQQTAGLVHLAVKKRKEK